MWLPLHMLPRRPILPEYTVNHREQALRSGSFVFYTKSGFDSSGEPFPTCCHTMLLITPSLLVLITPSLLVLITPSMLVLFAPEPLLVLTTLSLLVFTPTPLHGVGHAHVLAGVVHAVHAGVHAVHAGVHAVLAGLAHAVLACWCYSCCPPLLALRRLRVLFTPFSIVGNLAEQNVSTSTHVCPL